MEEFLSSPFMNSFKKLATFTQTAHVGSDIRYLDWLVRNNVRERHWTAPANLESFREYMRSQEEVPDQVNLSVENILYWCRENGNVPPKDFFSTITPLGALVLIQRNRLLPWVLLGYSKSVEQLISRFSSTQMLALDEFINLEHWLIKLQENPEKRVQVEELMEKRINEAS